MVHEDLPVPFELTMERRTISLEFGVSHLECIPKRMEDAPWRLTEWLQDHHVCLRYNLRLYFPLESAVHTS